MIVISKENIRNFSDIIGVVGKDAAVCVCYDDDLHIILEKRTRNEKDPWSGQVSLPGGHFEKNDVYIVNTARREFTEETSIHDFYILGGLAIEHPMNRLDMDVYVFLCRTASLKNALPERDEIEYFLFPRITDLSPKYGEYVFNKKHLNGLYFNYEGNIIWGMTARIIKYFKEIISLS
ncbi:MAG: NUDIX hydrolase [Thermoplasmata archaeon]